MKLFLAKIGIGIGLLLASLFGYEQNLSLGSYNPTGGGTYRLQSSVSSTQTTLTLTSFKEPVSAIPYTMTYLNSSIEYATLDPLNTTSKEFISFTGITQNADNTATLTGVTRGLGFSYPYTASTTLAQAHSGQSILILSNPPQLYTQQLILANQVSTSSVSTVISSTSPWRYDLVPANHAIGTYVSTTSELASVAYVNSVALVSAPNASTGAKGVVQIASTGQTTVGTASGSTGALLVVPTSLFNSTASSATIVPVTGPTGKLDPMFISTSSSSTYNWGAAHTFNGTTIVASSTQYTTNVGQINATSTPKLNSFSLGDQIVSSFTNTTGTTQTSSTTLNTVIIPAGSFGTNKRLRITAQLQGTNLPGQATDVCDFNINFGTGSATTTVAFGQVGIAGGNGNYGTGQIDTNIFATSTTQQSFTSNAFQVTSASAYVNKLVGTYSLAPALGSSNYQGAGFSAVNLANISYVAFIARAEVADTCYIPGGTVELITQ